jgi:hypothetical protein
MTDQLSRRTFNALLVSAGAACALTPPLLRGEPAYPLDAEAGASPSPFAHPGMLHSRGDLARMRKAVLQRAQPLYEGFDKLRSHPESQPPTQARELQPRSAAIRMCASMSSTGTATPPTSAL